MKPGPQSQNAANRPAVAFLGADFETGNHGVSALAAGTIRSLHHTFAHAQVYFLGFGTQTVVSRARLGEASVPIDSLLLRFSKRPWQPNHVARLLALAALCRLAPAKGVRARLLARNAWLRRLSETQLFVAIAGGDSFSDIYGLRRLLYVALPQILVLVLGRPLVLLPQTYGPFKTPPARWLARFILRRARRVYSRDLDGLQVIRDLLPRKQVPAHFGYDMGFALEPLPPADPTRHRLQQLKASGLLVGVNVSGLLCIGGYNRANMFGLAADYRGLICALITFLIAELGCQVLLIPHVLGDDTASESDVVACREILGQLQETLGARLHFFDVGFDQHETKFLIGQCAFFIGSRMHACIAALSQGVPALGLAYSHKFAGVLDSIGMGSSVVDLRIADQPQVLGAVAAAFRNREALQRELRQRMPAVEKSVLEFFATDEFQLLLKPILP